MKTNQKETYNGWTNYPTWNVKLWIDNDERTSRYWLDETRSAIAIQDDGPKRLECAARCLAEQLETHHQEVWVMHDYDTGWKTDCLQWVLGQINWREIAESYVEDAWETDCMREDDEAKGGAK